MAINDYFSPYDQAKINYTDEDLGSSSVLLVPGTHEAITAGKYGNVYVLNTNHLGKFNNKRNNIIQTDTTALGGNKAFFASAFFNKTIYFATSGGKLEGLKLKNGKLSKKPIGESSATYGYPGASPSISANGKSDGIVWAIQRVEPASATPGTGDPVGYTVLNAYDATTMKELYSSATDPAGGGTTTPPAIKFTTPTIADGHVFVGTANSVLVYGLDSKATTQEVSAKTHNKKVHVKH